MNRWFFTPLVVSTFLFSFFAWAFILDLSFGLIGIDFSKFLDPSAARLAGIQICIGLGVELAPPVALTYLVANVLDGSWRLKDVVGKLLVLVRVVAGTALVLVAGFAAFKLVAAMPVSVAIVVGALIIGGAILWSKS